MVNSYENYFYLNRQNQFKHSIDNLRIDLPFAISDFWREGQIRQIITELEKNVTNLSNNDKIALDNYILYYNHFQNFLL